MKPRLTTSICAALVASIPLLSAPPAGPRQSRSCGARLTGSKTRFSSKAAKSTNSASASTRSRAGRRHRSRDQRGYGWRLSGSIKLPETDISLKIGGYVKLDAIHDFDAINSEFTFRPPPSRWRVRQRPGRMAAPSFMPGSRGSTSMPAARRRWAWYAPMWKATSTAPVARRWPPIPSGSAYAMRMARWAISRQARPGPRSWTLPLCPRHSIFRVSTPRSAFARARSAGPSRWAAE